MSGWYELSKAKDGQFHFVLKAGNGEIILTSELYKAKASAFNGIESVQKNSPEDGKYERLEAKNGKLYFNLKAVNHQVIGTSQMYSSTQTRDHGIESVKINGASEKVKDLTEA
ncbi:YegP family protein [Acinetobacter pollinis]|uniref:YegP family protein n=1 Tax=Acinetobacter pollinis TaxID=2605270 RepID=A0ABU6DRL0_9GAMM|nr:YegP family protein [Acinetobacter pollinis]MEB5476486.1 YegP family protein [Acinetobacter pollinis]